MAADIFISHATEDLAIATRAQAALGGPDKAVLIAGQDTGGRPFVKEIEAGLAKARAVLVLWSRHASASPWVQTERASAIALREAGRLRQVVMARLDETEVPPLSMAEIALDWRSGTPSGLDALHAVPPPSKWPEWLPRRDVHDHDAVAYAIERIRAGAHVALQSVHGGGAGACGRMVGSRLAAEGYAVSSATIGQHPNEAPTAYVDRMSRALLIRRDDAVSGRRAVVVSDWSQPAEACREDLANALRAATERGRQVAIVAVGGFDLWRMTRSGSTSRLNVLEKINLRDWEASDLVDVLGREDADWLVRMTGGLPELVARGAREILGGRSRDQALGVIQVWMTHQVEQVASHAQRGPDGGESVRSVLVQLGRGERVESKWGQEEMFHRLYYAGIARRRSEVSIPECYWYEARCSAAQAAMRAVAGPG